MVIDAIEWLASGESDLDAIFGTRFETGETSAFTFLESVERALALLKHFPHLGPIFARPFRRFLLQDRRLAIFYTVENRRIFIHALLDLRGDPTHLRRRLGIDVE